MTDIAFTTTATNRPDLLLRTYESFSSHIIDTNLKDCTLYINIDPAPTTTNIEKAIQVAKQFFGNVISNIPKKPNFTASVKWLWSKPQTDLIFHLEDDWILLSDIKLKAIIARFENPKIMQYPLRAYAKRPYNKLCLSPSVLRTSLCNTISKNLDITRNPEVQLRDITITGLRRGYNMAEEIIQPSKKVIIKDIGRAWAKKQKIKRPIKNRFTKWI